jgi:hypothetical protein
VGGINKWDRDTAEWGEEPIVRLLQEIDKRIVLMIPITSFDAATATGI